MKSTTLGLLIAAAAFAASTVFLSVQLHDERLQADKLAVETRALNARIAELEKRRGERQFAAMNPFAPLPPGGQSTGQVYRDEPSATAGNAVESVAIDAPPRHDEFFNKMMRAQIRAHHKQLYADVGALLGLSKDEASNLINLLTDQQLAVMKSWDGAASPQEQLRQMDEKKRQNQAQIAELIGADKAEKFEEFQRSMPARQELDMLAHQLDGADTPLNEDQQKRLLAVLTEERKRTPPPTMSDGTSVEDFSKAHMKWQADYEESVASQVRSVLNSEQLATFDEYQDWQRQMRSQMSVVHAGSTVTFAGAAPAVSMDLAVAPPSDPEKQRK